MNRLLIRNDVDYHYEIIESVIVKYRDILGIDDTTPVNIYLRVSQDNSFISYIKSKYPSIKFEDIKDYDFYIN
jgi:hypothetical protein